jgi:hypothetical protein
MNTKRLRYGFNSGRSNETITLIGWAITIGVLFAIVGIIGVVIAAVSHQSTSSSGGTRLLGQSVTPFASAAVSEKEAARTVRN